MPEKRNLSEFRSEFLYGSLTEESINKNPIQQFLLWFNEVLEEDVKEPNAMLLSTVGSNNRPSARVVLLKSVNNEGFTFFTNYLSKKGKQISVHQYVALTFFWKELERQVRIEGVAEKIDPKASDDYFQSRPYESRLSAIASPQSEKISSRSYLENLKNEMRQLYKEDNTPRPEGWGGYLVKPFLIEFWQGRSNRLHDRLVYELEPDGHWSISRLAP